VSVVSYRKIFGETIRAWRKKAALSQEKLAEKADLHPTYISRVENGKINISLDAIFRLAKALKTTISNLTKDI